MELAEEVANHVARPGSRKINGKYIQSHLVSRLKGMLILHNPEHYCNLGHYLSNDSINQLNQCSVNEYFSEDN